MKIHFKILYDENKLEALGLCLYFNRFRLLPSLYTSPFISIRWGFATLTIHWMERIGA